MEEFLIYSEPNKASKNLNKIYHNSSNNNNQHYLLNIQIIHSINHLLSKLKVENYLKLEHKYLVVKVQQLINNKKDQQLLIGYLVVQAVIKRKAKKKINLEILEIINSISINKYNSNNKKHCNKLILCMEI